MTEEAHSRKPDQGGKKKRMKMSLQEQCLFIHNLALRCGFKTPAFEDTPVKEAMILLSGEEIERLKCVADTLEIFEAYGADKFVKERATRRQRGRV